MTPPQRFCAVPTSAIEQPTALGSKCHLLDTHKLHPYSNTEEELLHALMRHSDARSIDAICRQGYCKFFFSAFDSGIIPALDKDPIELTTFNGKYWVIEGKHRVCAAKRAGVKQIEAIVVQGDRDLSPLPPVGHYGTFTSEYTERSRGEHRAGYDIFLYADLTKGMGFPNVIRKLLGTSLHNYDTWEQIIPGIYAQKHILAKSSWIGGLLLGGRTLRVQLTIRIENDIPDAKIWLVRVPLQHGVYPDFSRRQDLFRRGLFRPPLIESVFDTWSSSSRWIPGDGPL